MLVERNRGTELEESNTTKLFSQSLNPATRQKRQANLEHLAKHPLKL